MTSFVTAASDSEKTRVYTVYCAEELVLRRTHQNKSTSRKDRPVSDAPTTTILALTATFGSMVNFLLMRLRANGA